MAFVQREPQPPESTIDQGACKMLGAVRYAEIEDIAFADVDEGFKYFAGPAKGRFSPKLIRLVVDLGLVKNEVDDRIVSMKADGMLGELAEHVRYGSAAVREHIVKWTGEMQEPLFDGPLPRDRDAATALRHLRQIRHGIRGLQRLYGD